MSSQNRIAIQITLDGENTVVNGVHRISGSLDQMAGSAKSAIADVAHLGGAFLAFQQAVGPLMSAARALDEFSTAASRIGLVSDSLSSAARAQAELFSIAQQSRTQYTGLAEVYSRLARSGQELGVSQERLLGVTRSISQAMTIGGGSAESMKAALVQLSQGFASGTLRGEELNSVMEQTPRLAQAIAEGMGVSIGELRKLGEAGKLTAVAIIEALEKTAPKLAAEFGRMTPTISQAFTVFQDGASRAFYEFDKGAGISADLAKSIDSLGKTLGEAGNAARSLGEKYGGAIRAIGEIATWIAAAGAATKLLSVVAALARYAMNPITITIGLSVVANRAAQAYLESQTGIESALRTAESEVARLRGRVSMGGTNEALNRQLADAEAKVRRLQGDLAKVIATAAQEPAPLAKMLDAQGVNASTAATKEAPAWAGAKPLDEIRQYAKTRYSIISEWQQKTRDTVLAFDRQLANASAGERDGLLAERQALLQGIGDDARKALENLNKPLVGSKNDLQQALRERLSLLADAEKRELSLIKERVDAGNLSEYEGIQEAATIRQRYYQDVYDAQQQLLNSTRDQGDRARIMGEMAKTVIAWSEIEQRATLDVEQAWRKSSDAFFNAAEKQNEALDKQIEKAREELASIGLTLDGKDRIRAASLGAAAAQADETAAVYEAAKAYSVLNANQVGADFYAAAQQASVDRAAKLRELAYLEEQQGARRVAVKAAEESAKAWEKFTDDIGRGLTDALYRSFESGKGFGESFAKSLENTFKTMVLKFAIQSAVTTGSNLVNTGINSLLGTSGSNNGAGVNYLGLASNANTIYNLANGSMLATLSGYWGAAQAGAGLTAAEAAAAANAYYSAGYYGTGAAIQAGAAWGGATAGTAAAGSAAAGSAAAGSAGAATAAGTGAAAAEGAAAGGAMAGAGSVSWIPYVGWAIAAAALVYSLKDKIFGGDWQASGAPRMVGTFNDVSGGMSGGTIEQDEKKSGGWFGKSGSRTVGTPINDEFDRVLDQMYQSARSAYSKIGEAFDDKSLVDKLVGFSLRVNIADARDAQAAFESMSKQLTEAMGKVMFPSIERLKVSGEEWQKTFERVVGELGAVDAAFRSLGTTIGVQFGRGNVDRILALSDSLVTFMGGIEKMQSDLAAYYQGYYTQVDQTDIARQALEQQFSDLGLVMPETRTGFRRLVESLDLTTTSGQKTYASLISISTAFGDMVDKIASGLDATTSAIEQALNGLFSGINQQIADAKSGVASAQATVGGIGLLSPSQISNAVATAVPNVPTGANVLSTQQALAQTRTSSQAAIDTAIAARDAEQQAVNERNRGWAVRLGGISLFGGAYNGGEQVNEYNNIVAQAAAQGILASSQMNYSNYRNSSASFSLANGYQFFLDGAPIGADLSLIHGQDWVSANDNRWGRYNRDLGIYSYKPVGTETLNPAYDQAVANAKMQGAANITAAEKAATQAQIDYANAIRQYVVDASKAVEKLNSLREETLRYYEAQKALSDQLLVSAQGLRQAVLNARLSQLSPEDLQAQRRMEFDRAYSLALSTTGSVQAGYADKMAALLPALVSSMQNTAVSQYDWMRSSSGLYAQSNTVAGLLETQAAVDYQTETLGLLGAIDASLSLIEANASSAEKIISDAIYATGQTNADGLRAVIAAIQGKPIPAFATGGFHSGGARLVGEFGPEVEVTGPARYYSADQTRRLLSGAGDQADLLAEMRALRDDNQRQAVAMAMLQARVVKLMERWDGQGMPETRVVA